MYKEIRGMTVALSIGILATLFLVCAQPTLAQPTADNFGVEDTSGCKRTNVVVPVNITNVQSGPVISIIFDIAYDNSVINVVDVQKGTLTSFWDNPAINNFAWGTRVSLVYDGQMPHALQNRSTGSVVLLTFNVIGKPNKTSEMNLTNIQLADEAYNIGTAPTKNGTFSIERGSKSSPPGRLKKS